MKNKIINLLTIALLSTFSIAANASYTYYLKAESSGNGNGLLSAGSIRFVKAGDGTGLPPTEIITPPPIVDGGSGEVEYSEEQSCLVETNADSAKAQVEQYPSVIFGGLFYNASSEKACIAHALLPMKTYSSTCKASNANKLNAIILNMDNTMFGFTYEFTGGC